jgi:threonylcarbamoyladenosine tRNA methylthiotransferase MtaB
VPAGEVLQTVRQRIHDGHKEIVLTGTKIGAYRDGDTTLAGLVRMALGVPGLLRLRLSSLQPGELSGELLSLWEDSRLCPHLHLSLQSGSPGVLRRMGRAYSPSSYMRSLEAIRAVAPDAAVTTDVIVGFPGESDSEFGETVSFCEAAEFARIHVFPFSPRPGTRAAAMGGRVSSLTMRERVDVMRRLASSNREKYARSWLGRTVDVLWEEETNPGSHVYSGTSRNYLRLLCHSALPLHNVLEDVMLERLVGDEVWARRACEDTCGCQAELESGLR